MTRQEFEQYHAGYFGCREFLYHQDRMACARIDQVNSLKQQAMYAIIFEDSRIKIKDFEGVLESIIIHKPWSGGAYFSRPFAFIMVNMNE